MKLPSKYQWRQFLKILSKEEKIIFSLFLFLFIASLSFLFINFYFKNTEIQPAEGGKYIEGVVGSPRFINPIYVASDVDRDLVELIYSGLMKYDPEGKIIPDLAKDYKILDEGKVYEFYLKENLFWQDYNPPTAPYKLTADDVIFTIKTIQNPEIKSPLRVNWLGVEVEKISENAVSFRLKNPSAVFLENCTLKIIPEHIWKDISPQNFPLAIQNLKPIGSGPFQLKNLNQNEQGKIISLDLVRNLKYFDSGPNLSQITFQFFVDETELIKSYKKGEIKGFSLTSTKNFTNNLESEERSVVYSLSLPRYFAIFFNSEKAKILSEKEVRQALNYGINKEEILKEVLKNQGKITESPILPEIYGFEKPAKIYEYNVEKAKEILKKAGFIESESGKLVKIIKKEPAFQFKSNLRVFSQGAEVKELQKCLSRDSEIYPEGEISGYFGPKTKEAVIRFQEKYKKEILDPQGLEKGTGDVLKATRTKLNEVCFESSEEVFPLEFSLATVDQPILKEVATQVQQQWEALGVKVEIKTFNISALEREVIKPRNYEMLLFGEVLGAIPDPFPFWHSSQKNDPGLNLAIYENKKCDKLLEEARKNLDENLRKEKLEEFQDILIEDAPAVFLYNPDYLYFVSKEIKGVGAAIITDPSQRFSNIEGWYIKTKRAFK